MSGALEQRPLDVLCLGEALVDLVARDVGALRSVGGFTRHAGGAPANVARGLARLGARVGWAWAVGDDEFGHYLVDAIAREGVDVARALYTREAKTPICFVAIDPAGERTFVGYGHPDASRFFPVSALDADYLARARFVHVGSNTLIVEPSRTTTLQAMSWARDAGALVSLDVNLRLHLWPDHARVRAAVRLALGGVHVLKVSEEEAAFLSGRDAPLENARWLCRAGVGLAVVTLGARGCVWATATTEGEVAGFRVPVLDTTGAGDGFVAGLLHALCAALRDDDDEPALLPTEVLESALRAANAAGAAAVRTRGACEWTARDRP